MNYDSRRGFWSPHAPGAELDYSFNWKSLRWFAEGETILSSTWTASAGITLSRQQLLAPSGICSVFAAGGIAGREYRLTNTITTSEGRSDSRSITLICARR